jgi:hypothetical protein
MRDVEGYMRKAFRWGGREGGKEGGRGARREGGGRQSMRPSGNERGMSGLDKGRRGWCTGGVQG